VTVTTLAGDVTREPISASRGANSALIVATIAVSFSAILIRIAGDDPATVVWLRMGMAAVLLAPWVVRDARGRALPRDQKQAALVAVSGLLLAGHFLLWTASLRYTSIASSVLLVSLHPAMVAPLGQRLYRERLSRLGTVGMVVAVAGTFFTCVGDLRLSVTALYGDLLAVAGAACLAGYLVIGRGVRGSLGVAGYSAAVYAVVAVVAGVFAVAAGSAHMPTPRVAATCLGLAVVCTIGGHTVYNWTLRHVHALRVSVSFLGEAPLTAALAALIFRAYPSSNTVVGGVLILGGVAMTMRYQ
jgi:drug/metabolite transporter (DMT)-like permease